VGKVGFRQKEAKARNPIVVITAFGVTRYAAPRKRKPGYDPSRDTEPRSLITFAHKVQ
jgi:hypothetical protein